MLCLPPTKVKGPNSRLNSVRSFASTIIQFTLSTLTSLGFYSLSDSTRCILGKPCFVKSLISKPFRPFWNRPAARGIIRRFHRNRLTFNTHPKGLSSFHSTPKRGGVKKIVEMFVGNARRSVPCCQVALNSNGLPHSTGNGTASIPYGALNSFPPATSRSAHGPA
jgi:hypothetical protein